MVNARFKLLTIFFVILASFLVINDATANSSLICVEVENNAKDCGYVLSEDIEEESDEEEPVISEDISDNLNDVADAVNDSVLSREQAEQDAIDDQIALENAQQPAQQSTQEPAQQTDSAVVVTPETSSSNTVNTENTAVVQATETSDDTDELQQVASTPAPVPVPQPITYTYPQAQGYTPKPMHGLYNGGGTFPGQDATTNSLLAQMGYSASTLWSAGIKIVAYPGLVSKNCVAGSSIAISGMAVKPVTYSSCPDGQQVIPESYKTAGKCTVHYDASKNWGGTAYGNSKAVLAHELSHCLHFLYGEYGSFDAEFKNTRGIGGFSQPQFREVMADDFMICRHGVDTSWGGGSYYNQYGVAYPSAQMCADLNGLFNRYFPV